MKRTSKPPTPPRTTTTWAPEGHPSRHPSEGETQAFIPTDVRPRVPSAIGDSGEVETPPFQAMPPTPRRATMPIGPHAWPQEPPPSPSYGPGPHVPGTGPHAPFAAPALAPAPAPRSRPVSGPMPTPVMRDSRNLTPTPVPMSQSGRSARAGGADDRIPFGYVLVSAFFLMIAALGFGVWLVFCVISL